MSQVARTAIPEIPAAALQAAADGTCSATGEYPTFRPRTHVRCDRAGRPHVDAVLAINNRRPLEPIGDIPPIEHEQAYYRGQRASGSSPGVQVTKTKLLIKIGFIYHNESFDPIIDLLLADDRSDVYFALD
jgi:hypothetical protein